MPTCSSDAALAAPTSSTDQNALGDPQKTPPCGGGEATGPVTTFQAGETITITIDETIYHPGHFRVSLARRINALPPSTAAEMKETERGPRSAAFPIDRDPASPVLVDGLWENDERRTGLLETEIQVPNIDCEGCFLQIVQFMVEQM